MRIAIIGAGFAGMSAAYDMGRAGHEVVIYEGARQVGGLASGFQAPGWEWSLERFYHHVFQTDKALLGYLKEIGADDLLFFRRPVTAIWCAAHGGHPFDGALQVLSFPHLPLLDKVRAGLMALSLKARRDWQTLEQTTADSWLRRVLGERAYRVLGLPVLEGKFGPYYQQINMAWFWARIVARSQKLGYFKGGFQMLSERMAEAARSQGATIHLSTPVREIRTAEDGGLTVVSSAGIEQFDQVLSTTSPTLLRRMVPELPASYTQKIEELRSMGAIVVTLALDRKLAPRDIYWMNLTKEHFPFLALVEHTNFIERERYGGQHIVYLGDYLTPDHEYFKLTDEELLARFLPALRKINPDFTPEWVQDSWVHREIYAQPVVGTGHSANIPALQTPLPGLFWASMSQVYPWDRGTNFAVEIGRRVATEMLSSPTLKRSEAAVVAS